ncbi:MAG TPA: tryptophan 2,3-dioxygenase family protein [Acidimicrobiia bacterium]|jgi:tryptophan 2,3-dioxygenase
MDAVEPLYYADYLQLDRLLSSQELESAKQGETVHDEMLFIIVHQAYELWFKQILWELDEISNLFSQPAIDESEMLRIVGHLDRITEIQKLLIAQIDVLETMTPLDFLEFRDYLIPASGFQSAQFRLIENHLGVRPQDRVRLAGSPYTTAFSEEDRSRVEAAEQQPNLFELVDRWLARTPFLEQGDFVFWDHYREAVHAVLDHDRMVIEKNPHLTADEREEQLRSFDHTFDLFEAIFDPERHERLLATGERRLSFTAFQAALFINLYRHEPALQEPFRLVTLLVDIDQGFTAWRYRHALMTMRMIGRRVGTGGSAGAAFLTRSAEKSRVFSDLVQLATFMIPRSALPELPPEVERRMRFRFEDEA